MRKILELLVGVWLVEELLKFYFLRLVIDEGVLLRVMVLFWIFFLVLI